MRSIRIVFDDSYIGDLADLCNYYEFFYVY